MGEALVNIEIDTLELIDRCGSLMECEACIDELMIQGLWWKTVCGRKVWPPYFFQMEPANIGSSFNFDYLQF